MCYFWYYIFKTHEICKFDFNLKFFSHNITGQDFLKLTEQKFKNCEFKVGPVTRLVEFTKKVKEKKLRVYSSFHTQADIK